MSRPLWLTRLSRALVVLLALAAMTLLVMWMSGVFGKKLPPTDRPAAVTPPLPAGVATVQVAVATVPVREEAVGAVRAVQEVQVAARILARIRSMHITAAGQIVKQGDLLVEFDDEDLKARLSEAEAAQRSAAETRTQAERELAREKELHAQSIASDRAVENASTALATATANVERAVQNAKAAASEIVPLAAAGSRSFEVKVTGPCPPGLFSGMFGRLFVDLGTRSQLRVPKSAVRAIGQIDQVVVVDARRTMHRRFVVLGERQGDQVEVMSGVAAGETVVADASALRSEAGR